MDVIVDLHPESIGFGMWQAVRLVIKTTTPCSLPTDPLEPDLGIPGPAAWNSCCPMRTPLLDYWRRLCQRDRS